MATADWMIGYAPSAAKALSFIASGADPYRAAGWLGMSVEVLLDVYGHHHPTYLRGAARNVTAKPKRDVAVVETVVDLEARQKMMRKA